MSESLVLEGLMENDIHENVESKVITSCDASCLSSESVFLPPSPADTLATWDWETTQE